MLVGKKVSRWEWSAFCTGGAQVRIKNSSKHIVISLLATLISTATHSHCSTKLALFPEELFLFSSFFSFCLVSQCHPPSSSFHCLSSPKSLPFSASLQLIPLDLLPSLFFSIKLVSQDQSSPSASSSSILSHCGPPPYFLLFIPCIISAFLPLSSLLFSSRRPFFSSWYWCKHTQSSECFLSCSDRSTCLPELSQ